MAQGPRFALSRWIILAMVAIAVAITTWAVSQFRAIRLRRSQFTDLSICLCTEDRQSAPARLLTLVVRSGPSLLRTFPDFAASKLRGNISGVQLHRTRRA
jgi:hypothetical protein